MRAQNTLSSAIRRQCVVRWRAMACVLCALSLASPTHRCWTRRAHSKAQTWLKLVSLICLLRLATSRRWKITLVSNLSKEKHKNLDCFFSFFYHMSGPCQSADDVADRITTALLCSSGVAPHLLIDANRFSVWVLLSMLPHAWTDKLLNLTDALTRRKHGLSSKTK